METINFYTLDKVKKFLPKIKDDQVKYTGMPLHQHILICGSTGSGKSNTLQNYIYLTSLPDETKGTYKKIFFCCMKEEPFNRFLKDQLKDDIVFYQGLSFFPSVDEFPDLSEKNKDNFLVIFDDVVNEKSTASLNKIKQYFTYARSKGITCIFLTQSYFDTNLFVRKNISWVILCGISSNKDLIRILKEHNLDLTKDQLLNMYNYAKEPRKKDEINFLKICCYECPKNKRFSRNFLDYLND